MRPASDAVWIERFGVPAGSDLGAAGPLVAVKDLIDVEGSVTTAGCRALAERAVAAERDAPCVESVRRAGGRLLGKVNLHELAYGVTGVNPWYGTPPNPADPGRIPGGSSSGSAVAVATGEADVGLGSDTGGSVRIPAACCGVVGLKTTHGRVSLDGVWPLAPSFDTVGPLARDVAGVVRAMALLEPGFAPAADPPGRVGRAVFGPEISIDPVIEAAVDEALRLAELELSEISVSGWREAWRHHQLILSREALDTDRWLIEETGGEGIGKETLERLYGGDLANEVLEESKTFAASWVPELVSLLSEVGVMALPTLWCRPPMVGETVPGFTIFAAPVNLCGLPAISLPVPAKGRPPVGLQLVAAHGQEELLVAVAARIEAAAGSA